VPCSLYIYNNCQWIHDLCIVGGHILSGACVETRALDELFPDWKDRDVSYLWYQTLIHVI